MRLFFLILLWSASISHSKRIAQKGLSFSLEDGVPNPSKTLASFLLAPSSMVRTRNLHSGAIPVSQLRSNPRHSWPIAQVIAPQEDLLKSFIDASEDELDSLVEAKKDEIGSADIREIDSRAASDESWLRVKKAILMVRHRAMEAGKELLEEILAAGEIRALDAKITELAKNKQIDPAFLAVVNENIEAAQTEGDDMTINLLTHISSRVSEELEKTVKPEVGVLAKLMRMDEVGIRSNILKHYLAPQSSIDTPDGRTIPVDPPKPAIVHPMKFSEAVSGMVTQLRSLDIDGQLCVTMIEEVRDRAIEARAVVVENYPESVVNEFSDALTPIFQPDRAAKEAAAAAARAAGTDSASVEEDEPVASGE